MLDIFELREAERKTAEAAQDSAAAQSPGPGSKVVRICVSFHQAIDSHGNPAYH